MAIKCAISGCDNEAEPFSLYCKVHSKKNVYYELQNFRLKQKDKSSGKNEPEQKKNEKD